MDKHIDKYLYKTFLTIIKYIPITLSGIFIINLILIYFGISGYVLSCIGGVSFIFLILLYLIAKVFKFCHLYTIPLNYITICNIVGLIDSCFTIPISTIIMYRFYFIFGGIMLISYICYMYKNRNNPKVDYIKNLCDRYC